MPVALTSVTVEISFDNGSSFTNVTSDVLAGEGIRTRQGMAGRGPADRVARPGTMEFVLRNDAGNSGGLQGYYSPAHANARAGWGVGNIVRLIARYSATNYNLWRGRVISIKPTPGRYHAQRVSVLCQDLAGDWVDAQLRELTTQINQTDTTLATQINNQLSSSGMGFGSPILNAYAATDTFPYAFDDLPDGATALTAIARLVMSTFGIWYASKTYENWYVSRANLASRTSVATLTESDVSVEGGIEVPTALEETYNRVRVTAHPRSVDAVNTTVLYKAPSAIKILSKEQVTIWGPYRDTNDKLIGAYDFQPFTAGTDVKANTAQNGSGADYTSEISGTGTTAFATTTKFVIQNNSPDPVWLVDTSGNPVLQIRGRGIHDNGDVTMESYAAVTNTGERAVHLDMPYQNDPNVAKDLADYVRQAYGSLAHQVSLVTINPQRSNALMLHALQREIADVITVSETMTGLSSADAFIMGIEYEIRSGPYLLCRWMLAPAVTMRAWTLDNATLSVLGTSTRLGFA